MSDRIRFLIVLLLAQLLLIGWVASSKSLAAETSRLRTELSTARDVEEAANERVRTTKAEHARLTEVARGRDQAHAGRRIAAQIFEDEA